MTKREKVFPTARWFASIACFLVLVVPPAHPQALVIDHTCTDLSEIPDAWIEQAKADLHIVYQHTSHGSQLVTGMNSMESYPSFGSKYEWSDNGSSGLDLDDYGIPGAALDLSQGDYIDGNGVTPWVTSTRNLLDNPANSHVNVVMWSWCSINMHHAQRYVDNMEILVAEYPGVQFVFMTGHAEGQGENLYDDPQMNGDGHVHYNNQLIRQHCSTHGRILFDFAGIEAYDPDGSYFWDLSMYDDLDYSSGNWGQEWCLANGGSELELLTTGEGVSGYTGCASCAHSDGPGNLARINCVLKGRAAWWMFARIVGWDGGTGPTATVTRTPTRTPTAPTPTPWPTGVPTRTPTATPSGRALLAVMKREGAGDQNLYYYSGLALGDWSYWEAVARNPSACARDLWIIPAGNAVLGVSALPGSGVLVMKGEGAVGAGLYLFESLAGGDWRYGDCGARNPSPMARDLWVVPAGDESVAISTVDDMNMDGRPDLAVLKKSGAGDMNLYCYNALQPGDWTYWDCRSRNPSPLARDFWIVPSGSDVAGMASIDVGGGVRELALIKREGAGDLNLYLYSSPAQGDWRYWDCRSRNPSPLARDLWIIPSGNDAIGMTPLDADGDGRDELCVLKREGAGDQNLYYFNSPQSGDWIYWDSFSRNPSPLARDLWIIPSGNGAVGITAAGP